MYQLVAVNTLMSDISKIKVLQDQKLIELRYENTRALVADVLTKNLDEVNFKYHTKRIMNGAVIPGVLRPDLEEVCQVESSNTSLCNKTLKVNLVYPSLTYAESLHAKDKSLIDCINGNVNDII